MPTKPFDYFKALVVCLIAAGVYEKTAVPMLVHRTEVPTIAKRDYMSVTDPRILNYFPEGSWQRDNPMQIETELGILLFKEWTNIENPSANEAELSQTDEAPRGNKWKLSPVTLLLRDSDVQVPKSGGNEGAGRPIMLDAPLGAEIEFAQSFKFVEDTPPVTGGHLIGQVQIIGPATRPDGSDRLQIDASDVRINGKKIWTLAPVMVRFGDAVAKGRDLTIALAGGGKLPTERPDSPLAVLNELTLIELEQLRVPLKEGSLWPALPEVLAARPPGSIPPAGTSGLLDVSCKGALRFDFATYTLSLHDNVSIEHRGAGLPKDVLQCPHLEIQLEDPFGNSVATPQPTRMIRRIRAFGGNIHFEIPTLLARADCELIDANFATGVVNIDSRREVSLFHRSMQLLLSKLEYRFKPGMPTELRYLKVDGSGKLIAHDTSMPLRSFSWQDQLSLFPDEGPNQYRLGLVKAKAILPDDGIISTDSLAVGFSIPPINQNPSNTQATPDPAVTDRMRIERLAAQGNVLFDTSEVYAQTDMLRLVFDNVTADTPEEQKLRLNSAEGGSSRLWTREPESSPSEQASLGSKPSAPRPRLSGRTLSANILTDGKNSIVNQFQIDNDVKIEHILETERGPTSVVLKGKLLKFIDAEQGQIVQVEGFPAQIDIGDGYFRGPLIQMRMDENFVFMDRAGQFRLPSGALNSVDINGGATDFRWIDPPKCSWKGQMHFDGRIAQLTGGVVLAGAVATLDEPSRWDLHIGCDAIEVELADRILLKATNSNSKSEVKRLSFKGIADQAGNVTLSAVQSDVNGQMIGSHQMQVPQIDLMPQTSMLEGAGPGWYHTWIRPQATDSGPMASIAEAGEWMAGHLVYQEAFRGNLAQKTLSFLRGIRVAAGPVASEEHRIDAVRIIEPLEGQAILSCDELRLTQTPDVHQFNIRGQTFGSWELQALENVAFANRNKKGLFKGNGDRIGYSANKDLFILEGRQRPARLFLPQGGNIDAYLIEVKPKTMELKNMKLQGGRIDLGQFQQAAQTQGQQPAQPPAANSRPAYNQRR